MDFTLRKYAQICKTISTSGYNTITVADFFRKKKKIGLSDNLIILRHDVDRFPRFAIEMAKIENRYGLVATYYFRMPFSWNKKIIKEIEDKGHEVGLHYECLDKSKGNVKKAGEILAIELSSFREIANVITIAMHGNPITRYDNRDMWNSLDLRDFGLIGEAYLTMDFEKVLYYSDTGRTWQDGKFNLKDTIPKNKKRVINKPNLTNTNDLCRLIKQSNENLYILVHPSRWQKSFIGWFISYTSDLIINIGKLLFKIINTKS